MKTLYLLILAIVIGCSSADKRSAANDTLHTTEQAPAQQTGMQSPTPPDAAPQLPAGTGTFKGTFGGSELHPRQGTKTDGLFGKNTVNKTGSFLFVVNTEEKKDLMVEIGYNGGKTGQHSDMRLTVTGEGGLYDLRKDAKRMVNVTKCEWGPDSGYISYSADFEAEVTKLGMGKEAPITVKGSVKDYQMMYPARAIKNAVTAPKK